MAIERHINTEVYQWLLIVCAVSLSLLGSAFGNEENFVQADNVCSCPNDVLTYTCTVVGGTATIWGGSAFDCLTGGIILRHSEFVSGGTSGSCNNGAIVGQSIRFADNCYTSQLNVTLNMEMNNKTIQCRETSRVGEAILSVISVVPPSNLSLAAVNQGNVTFNWTPAASSCPVSYQTTFNCGSCPNMTRETTVTCSDLQLSTSETLCLFTVRSICRTFIGNQNNSVAVALKVPNIPDVRITPIYSAENQILSRIEFNISEEAVYNITNDVLSSIENYNISYHYDDDEKINNSVRSLPSNAVIELLISNCHRNNVSVSISAISGLGEGPSSDPYNIDCNNTIVTVKYSPDTATIACMFLIKSDTSNKTCSVRYGKCDEELNRIVEESSSNRTIHLELMLHELVEPYCYIVTASNDTVTIRVEGRIGGAGNGHGHTAFIISGVVIFLLFLILVIPILVILAHLLRRSKGKFAGLPPLLEDSKKESNTQPVVELAQCTDNRHTLDEGTPRSELKKNQQTTVDCTSLGPLPPSDGIIHTPSAKTGRSTTPADGRGCKPDNVPPEGGSSASAHGGHETTALHGEQSTPESGSGCHPTPAVGHSEPARGGLSMYPDHECSAPTDSKPVPVDVESSARGNIGESSIAGFFVPNLVYSRRFDLKLTNRCLKSYDVKKEGELREYIVNELSRTYKRGCVFYEFYYEIESISQEQEIIFTKDYKEFYYSNVQLLLSNGFFGEEVQRPFCGDYKIFIQCIGSGARYLPKGSKILLYENAGDEQLCNIEELPLRRVISDQFEVLTVAGNTKLNNFQMVNDIPKGVIFLEFKTFVREGGGDIIDVLLMDEDRNLFSGPKARHMVQKSYQCRFGELSADVTQPAESNTDGADDSSYVMVDKLDEWTALFVLPKKQGNPHLQNKELILCQRRHNPKFPFILLEEDKDNEKMREFINRRLNTKFEISFENGRAFYQLSAGQDLTFYKDILLPPAISNKKNDEEFQLEMKNQWYYDLGAPDKPSNKAVFVQSTSNGSRCLKRGARILYRMDDQANDFRSIPKQK